MKKIISFDHIALLFTISIYLSACKPMAPVYDQEKLTQSPYTKYYCDSYQTCSTAFLKIAAKMQETDKTIQFGSNLVPSKTDANLNLHYLYFPAKKVNEKILIISSGIHGIEGYMGSAVQQFFLDQIFSKIDRSNQGILLLHSINPYGFKFNRRVTENNIDLNRNSSVDNNLYNTKNSGYAKLISFLNPEDPANTGSFGNRIFFLRSVYKIATQGMSTLRQAIVQGQYEFPKGLYFGGKALEPNVAIAGEIIKKFANKYSMILALDLHTGYGERAKLHLFGNATKDKKIKDATHKIFTGYQIDWGDSADFYTVTGDFTEYVGKLYPGKFYIPMTLEYGTMDSQTTSGSVRSIQNMILENQGHQYSYKSEEDKKEIQKMILEMYFPSSIEWRHKTMKATEKLINETIAQWNKFKIK